MNQAFAEIRECVKCASDRAVSYADLHSLVQTSPQANTATSEMKMAVHAEKRQLVFEAVNLVPL